MLDQSVFLRSRIASCLAAATDDNTAKPNCICRTGYTQLGRWFSRMIRFLRSRIASRLAEATDDDTAKSNCICRAGYTLLGRSFARRLASKVTPLPVLRPTHNPQTGGRRLRVFVTRPGPLSLEDQLRRGVDVAAAWHVPG
jgi:hypothetical protein